MFLKRVIVGALPSFVVDSARNRRALIRAELERQKGNDESVHKRGENETGSWLEACERAGTYEEELINRFRAARSASFVSSGSLLETNILSVVAGMISKPNISVTDFGGATGDLGVDFLAAYPQANFNVVENPTLVSLLKSMPSRGRVQFSTEIPPSCDVFYTSGTLQYLDDPLDYLARGLKSAHSAAILRRNNFAEVEIFDVQKSRLYDNGGGPIPEGFPDCEISYPRRTLIESEVVDLARSLGFEQIGRLEGDGLIHGYRSYTRQLVFRRRIDSTGGVAISPC